MENSNIVIGIDMGATHTRLCIMNATSDILVMEKRKTHDIIAKGFISGLISFCEEFIPSQPINRIIIGLPAAVSAVQQKVLSVPNLAVSQEELNNLIPNLSQYFNCPVLLERDVNLQMIYDVYYHKSQDKLALGVYLGTGMGFSIWNKGTLFTGAHGVAGELGHIPYGDEKARCGCGNYGCLETICSGIALKKWYESHQRDYPLEAIFKQARQDPFIKNYLVQIAKAITTVVNLFDPDLLILGGGVMDMQGFPMRKLKALITKYIRKPLPYDELIILKAASSSFNGAIGAALYAQQYGK
ncbi:MAG TPA: allose kinase [Pasteurellaceae bacterium]|nr:allose kinase [Pasteurellaceae bacterium]